VLFSGKYKVVTEMGRSLFLKAGTSFTRVENVKVNIFPVFSKTSDWSRIR